MEVQRAVALLEVVNVWKRYGGRWVLKGVNLEVGEREVVVVVGPNGAGKTTLLKVVAGLTPPSRGSVMIAGHPPRSLRARRLLGVVLHHSLLYDELTVEENLRYYARLYGVEDYDPWRDEVVEALGLRGVLRQRVSELSFGWRKRVDIARALLHRPRLVLADELLSGLDDDARRLVSSVVLSAVELGAAVLATSPRLAEALELSAARVYALEDGRLVDALGAGRGPQVI